MYAKFRPTVKMDFQPLKTMYNDRISEFKEASVIE
jgi:hypothetical protein